MQRGRIPLQQSRRHKCVADGIQWNHTTSAMLCIKIKSARGGAWYSMYFKALKHSLSEDKDKQGIMIIPDRYAEFFGCDSYSIAKAIVNRKPTKGPCVSPSYAINTEGKDLCQWYPCPQGDHDKASYCDDKDCCCSDCACSGGVSWRRFVHCLRCRSNKNGRRNFL